MNPVQRGGLAPRIILVTDVVPDPDAANGFAVRLWHLLRGLGAWAEVRVLLLDRGARPSVTTHGDAGLHGVGLRTLWVGPDPLQNNGRRALLSRTWHHAAAGYPGGTVYGRFEVLNGLLAEADLLVVYLAHLAPLALKTPFRCSWSSRRVLSAGRSGTSR